MSSSSSSTNSSANPKPSSTPKDPVTATKRLSHLTSPSKNSSSRSNSLTANNRRLSNAVPAKSFSLNTHASDELERERAKIDSLKALVSAAEEKEADAASQCAIWRSKANELSSTIDRMENELGEAQDFKSKHEKLTKEVEKLRAANKERERAQLQLTEEFESSRATWTEEEANLRAQLSTVNSQLASLQKEPSSMVDEPQDSGSSPASSAQLTTPLSSSTSPTSPQEDQTAPLKAEVESLKAQKAAFQASMEQAVAASEALKAQLADLARVNEQLMDDNESYQILVGERTLMGGFDIKQLLRVDDDSNEIPSRTLLRSSPRSSSTPSLEGVEEEDEEEEDDDADAAIERAVLESHGNGSRTTGAVEAGISQTPKPKRIPNLRKESTGMGLDLAAELAQAEDIQVQEGRKAVLQEKKNSKKLNKDKDLEIKGLKDTNKALVLYISKILDRIAAHDGFEKVLSSDYGNKSPRSQRTQSPTIGGVIQASKSATANSTAAAATNPAPKRSSWMQYFTSLRSPPTQSNIKPLRLGTGASTTPGPTLISAGLSGGWTGVKEQPEQEENEDEARARERRLAEMKLHGLSSGSGTAAAETSNDSTVRANRRSTSMYGATSLPAGFTLDQNRRNSGGAGKLPANHDVADVSSATPLTQAALLKRNEEREKESKINLEKGQASGFTEIEIRGHRMRPSTNRQYTAPSGSLSPEFHSQTSPNQHPTKVFPSFPAAATTNSSTGIKDLKMTGDINNSNNDPANESIFARTARRISMMSGAK